MIKRYSISLRKTVTDAYEIFDSSTSGLTRIRNFSQL